MSTCRKFIQLKIKNFINEITTIVVSFFKIINYELLGQAIKEVIYLTILALVPLIINVIIGTIALESFLKAFHEKIIPGEILAYCLSFLSPSLYFLLTKTQGTQYKLPWLHSFSMTTFILYVSSIVLYLIVKNKWVPKLNMEPQDSGYFFNITLFFLVITFLFRIYSVYHSKNMGNYQEIRQDQQDNFNDLLRKRIP